ncbi:4638_t:CDS:2 [Entrophospora sp. SA101]|nr:4630_t:CDS:2 [Entrophospora sp. SA101]CAJ0648217.1 4638_t:CDS:2 [Entrophospora sp. SA101]CAJ0835658.1 119_t:CDS:2 [Entrophospora sp. SA101]
MERALEHIEYINEVGQQRKNLLKKRTKEQEEAKCSTRELRNSVPVDYSDSLSETGFSDLGHEESVADKRKWHEYDHDSDVS